MTGKTRGYKVDAADVGVEEWHVRATSHEEALRQIYHDTEEYRLVCLEAPETGEQRTVGFMVRTHVTIERVE